MSTATATKTARTLIAAGTSVVPATPQRGVLDIKTTFGGILTVKITNGATGPTVKAAATISIAHNATLPSAGALGADWKLFQKVDHSVTANAIGEWCFQIPQGVMALQVEIGENTAQNVTGEAFFSELTSINNA